MCSLDQVLPKLPVLCTYDTPKRVYKMVIEVLAVVLFWRGKAIYEFLFKYVMLQIA